jgi:hypothetical protein
MMAGSEKVDSIAWNAHKMLGNIRFVLSRLTRSKLFLLGQVFHIFVGQVPIQIKLK